MTGLDLQIERVRHRVKQHQVAAVLGIHPSGLSHLERSDQEIPPDVAVRVVSAISVASGDLRSRAELREEVAV